MAEENQLAVFEEDTPITPIHSQAPTMYAPPPHLSPAGVPPAHRGAFPTHLPPPASPGLHPAYSEGQPSSATDDRARIAVLESTVNQLAATMATNMAELMALLKCPNLASSRFTPPLGYRPAVDPSPWAQPTLIPDNGDTSVPTIVNAPAALPVNNLPAPPSFSYLANLPVVTPIPPATMLEPPMPVPPSISTLLLTLLNLPHTTQPHIGLSYQAPPPINIAYSVPGTPSHAAPRVPLINFLPETGTEQEQRLKKLEENTRAFQSGDSRLDAGDGDWSLFPGMQLPPKIKYWDYEEFVIHTFQDSLAGADLDWYMSLKAADIPTWADLSSKFIDQYKYCAETPPTLLELSTMEMTEDQGFEAYTVKWRAKAAKHQVYHSAPPTSFSSPVPQQYAQNYAPAPPQTPQYKPPASRTPQPTQQAPAPQGQQGGATQTRQRKQFTPLPVPLSHIYQQLIAGFAAVGAAPTPFVIEVLAREPYQDSKVPWTYEESVGNLEQQFSVMSVTRSGRVYANLEAARKGKAPAVLRLSPGASSIPQKMVTEEEAEAFMKIIKASEYKVVEQMAKSQAHISLLALLLNSEAH
ncbi:hypothetical protein CRG98_003944 [Punica granatum]|uniref:Retrotransposon gag domain-containing protein n=1 Tax=Punica granatum TaxID=22663 RepID=A0A2I0L4S0_PUNGR|nr:hypothetical protein CRG98_003944 [Punica granatum]